MSDSNNKKRDLEFEGGVRHHDETEILDQLLDAPTHFTIRKDETLGDLLFIFLRKRRLLLLVLLLRLLSLSSLHVSSSITYFSPLYIPISIFFFSPSF